MAIDDGRGIEVCIRELGATNDGARRGGFFQCGQSEQTRHDLTIGHRYTIPRNYHGITAKTVMKAYVLSSRTWNDWLIPV
jgi:hypothetical protein